MIFSARRLKREGKSNTCFQIKFARLFEQKHNLQNNKNSGNGKKPREQVNIHAMLRNGRKVRECLREIIKA